MNFPDNPSEGQYHTDQGIGWQFIEGRWVRSKQGQTLTIGMLDDVNSNSPSADQVLKYDGAKFVNSDVTINTPTDNKNLPTTRYPFHGSIFHSYCGSNRSYLTGVNGWVILFDPHGMLDTTGNNSQLRIPLDAPAGWWRINTRLGVYCGKSAVQNFNVYLTVNGVIRAGVTSQAASDYSAKVWLRESASTSVYLEPNDYVRLEMWQKHDNGYGFYLVDQIMKVQTESTFTSATKRVDCSSFYTGFFLVGRTIEITGAGANDGTYTVASVGTHYVVFQESVSSGTFDAGVEYKDILREINTEFSGYLERIA